LWSAAGIDLSFHRIGRAGWTHDGVLRSWAEAPWLPFGGGVAIACLPGDAVWLGLTNTAASPAGVTLAAAAAAAAAAAGAGLRRLQVPPDWQLGWVLGADAQPLPLELAGAPTNAYCMDVIRDGGTPGATFPLVLMSPAAWASQFGSIEIPPAEQPPPVPAYSRMVRPRGLGSTTHDP